MFAPHEKARASDLKSYPQRAPTSDEQVLWSVPLPEYSPTEYTAKEVLNHMDIEEAAPGSRRWADGPFPDSAGGGEGAAPAIASIVSQRHTFEGQICFDTTTGRPLNPRGRTGLAGRGLLGQWGPNHAVDPIVTRIHPRTNQLQVVVAKRADSEEWALPGKFLGRGESVASALRAAFEHKASNFKGSDGETRTRQLLDELFCVDPEDCTVYRGYVRLASRTLPSGLPVLPSGLPVLPSGLRLPRTQRPLNL